MTKYEPHSCSKTVTAVKKISLVLKVSNFGTLLLSGVFGTYGDQQAIKANEMFSKMSGMWTICWVFWADEAGDDKPTL